MEKKAFPACVGKGAALRGNGNEKGGKDAETLNYF